MKIKSLHIKNFKSIVDLTINEPNPFTVFVGPNGSGKSNIFEALEYRLFQENYTKSATDDEYDRRKYIMDDLFPDVYNFNAEIKSFVATKDAVEEAKRFGIEYKEGDTVTYDDKPKIGIDFKAFKMPLDGGLFRFGSPTYDENGNEEKFFPFEKQPQYEQFINNHSEIFIKNKEREKLPLKSDRKLATSCDNLEKVLKRLLENEEKREEISEWLVLFIPEFDRIEVRKSDYSSNEDLLLFQKHYDKPFNKDLISDGTFNILCLLTAVYQSDEPQFLCIEEPENGLNPYVVRKLVDFFRQACQDKGHYIWLNTHSQTLVECLEPEEIIVVDKIGGETKVKQIKGMNLHGLDMAEVWLSGALGGGTPW